MLGHANLEYVPDGQANRVWSVRCEDLRVTQEGDEPEIGKKEAKLSIENHPLSYSHYLSSQAQAQSEAFAARESRQSRTHTLFDGPDVCTRPLVPPRIRLWYPLPTLSSWDTTNIFLPWNVPTYRHLFPQPLRPTWIDHKDPTDCLQ